MSLLTGLVAYWPFNEGAGVAALDAAANGNTGTLAGSPAPSWTAGNNQASAALLFNGSSTAVSLASNPILSITGDLTIAGWVNLTTANFGIILGSYNVVSSPFAGYGLGISINNLSKSLAFWSNNNPGGAWLSGTTQVSTGAWRHVAAVLAGGKLQFYVDATPDGSTQTTSAPSSYSGVRALGAQANAAGNFFNGAMYGIGLWSRGLLAPEIAQLHNGGLGLPHPFSIRRMGRPLGSRIIVP